MSQVRSRGDCEVTLWPDAVPWRGRRATAIGRVRHGCPGEMASLLLNIAAEHRGLLIAPLDGDTWHSYRLAVEGASRPPFALEPPTDPALEAALAEAGFAPILLYESTVLSLSSARIRRLGSASLRVRPFDPASAEDELARMHGLALASFAHAPLFTPVSFATFAAMYRPYVPRILPELALFAEDLDGTPTGFLFGLPDFAEGARPTTAILKTYAASRPGVGGVLAGAFHDAARKLGFSHVIHALMHEDNASLRHSKLLGAKTFRRYALFARPPA